MSQKKNPNKRKREEQEAKNEVPMPENSDNEVGDEEELAFPNPPDTVRPNYSAKVLFKT